MSERKLVIAIDGPAASGKSTTARHVARRLGYTYIDTGAMYRAVTFAVLQGGVDPSDQAAVERLVAGLDIRLERAGPDGSLRVLLDGRDVTAEIRGQEVTANVSLVSSYQGVRAHLVEMQRRIAEHGGVVLDGRDIGTVVFPRADVKVFMVADIQSRAERRHLELRSQGSDVALSGLEQQIAERDRFDSTRANSPLRKADDAFEIDTSRLTIDDQVEHVLDLVRQRQGSAE